MDHDLKEYLEKQDHTDGSIHLKYFIDFISKLNHAIKSISNVRSEIECLEKIQIINLLIECSSERTNFYRKYMRKYKDLE